jgi:magnesium transporter
MLHIYQKTAQGIKTVSPAQLQELPKGTIWLDLISPTRDEEAVVEKLCGIDIPTRQEMAELEISSRLYQHQGAVYMVATLPVKSDTDEPQTCDITFILAQGVLITLRYAEPKPFAVFISMAERTSAAATSPESVLTGILEAVVDRISDLLGRIQQDTNGISSTVFSRHAHGGQGNLQPVIEQIGRDGDLVAKMRESLLSLGRMLGYLCQTSHPALTEEGRARLRTLSADVSSLVDHANFMNSKVSFLLDATLGMIGIQQNNIIKIFSVVSVIFLPPTLVASIYGMNFEVMPELTWTLGYPMAILLMAAAAILPFLYFRKRGWL